MTAKTLLRPAILIYTKLADVINQKYKKQYAGLVMISIQTKSKKV